MSSSPPREQEVDLKFMTGQQMTTLFAAQRSKHTHFSVDSYHYRDQHTPFKKSFVAHELGKEAYQNNMNNDGQSRISAASKQCIGSRRKSRSREPPSDFNYDQNFGTNTYKDGAFVPADTKSAIFVPAAMKQSRESNFDSNVSFVFMNSGGINQSHIAPVQKFSSPAVVMGSATCSIQQDDRSHLDAVQSNN